MPKLKKEEYWSKSANSYDEAVKFVVGEAIQQHVTVQRADCENVSFPSGKFDTVFMANVIQLLLRE